MSRRDHSRVLIREAIRLIGTILVWSGLIVPPLAAEEIATAEVRAVADREITEEVLRAHISFLADDLLEGRGPASRGDQLAQRYIVAQFRAMGLQPAAPDGGWFQKVPLIGVTTHGPETVSFTRKSEGEPVTNNVTQPRSDSSKTSERSVTLRRFEELILSSGQPTSQVDVKEAELVFVGYGIVAPEYQWDDFKGTDLRGKVLVFMNNDPAADPELFGGIRRLYYGRWDYKYEMAAKLGAAAALIIHTTPSAGYPFQVVQTSWTGEQFELREKTGPRVSVKGWITEDGARKIFDVSGNQLDELRKRAEQRDFRPVPLGVHLSVALRNDVREQDTANVIGILPGTDPVRAEQPVIYMAHHDHIGMAAQRNAEGDQIYNGAIDNASGVASLLSIARAYTELPERPARSILFAAVGAEEQGLLGSVVFAQHPPRPPQQLAAVLNIDGVNILGPTHDVNFIGLGKSSLDSIVQRVAAFQNRVVTPDNFPDRGYYYRSDQFSLAKVGVPGVYLHSGIQVVGKPDGWGRAEREAWVEKHYHQPSDEYSDAWDLRGAILDQKLMFYTGWHIAQQPEMPTWTPGDEFEGARKMDVGR